MSRKGSLLSLRDRDSATTIVATAENKVSATNVVGSDSKQVAPSRQGKKAMTGYFSPEMSFAMHMTARKHGMSLQGAMADAFNDWLRKMGESPVGK
ncbi:MULTISPECIES: ribbon-helix-helix domain-containing protein [Acetobacter]|uniref:ribbon-helix-helix domain-containing protein n=1 Tax=Acetobacter TaxID=434 RepID=UPI000A37083E|nr:MULTISPECIES: ribbon-helix-helix domain-containing protein [Acetobacter]MBS0961409.1 hypothetical protein [Acetobacter thailandicus]OUJ10494.1 hypothetical protein HK25_06625 [Acetobacter sp. DsW_059]